MVDSYTVTLEVEVDAEKAKNQIDFDLTESSGEEMSGDASVNLQRVLDEAVSGVHVAETGAPTPVAHAISHAIRKAKSSSEE